MMFYYLKLKINVFGDHRGSTESLLSEVLEKLQFYRVCSMRSFCKLQLKMRRKNVTENQIKLLNTFFHSSKF